MKQDAFISPYIRIYVIVVGILAITIVSGALWLSQSPFFNISYMASKLREPIYTAQYHVWAGNTPAQFIGSRERVFADNDTTASVPVLVYHGIVPRPDNSVINLTIDQFKEHMFALKRAGYSTITLDELLAFVQDEVPLPARSVLVTFDDGRRDSYYNGDPLLAAVDFSAVMYPIGIFTEPSSSGPGGNYYLSSSETELLAKSDRWEIGSHSYNGHRQIPQNADGSEQTFFYGGIMWRDDLGRRETLSEFRSRISEDMRESQVLLEEITETPIRSLAFPFGNYGDADTRRSDDYEVKNIVLSEANTHYDLLFYQSSPQQYFSQAYQTHQAAEAKNLVRRINMTNDISGEELLTMLARGTAKTIPYSATLAPADGWVGAWGEHLFVAGDLVLDAGGRRSGAAVILDGTRHWENYRIDAEVSSQDGSSVILMVRHDSEGNTVACNYGRNFVHINQTVAGLQRVIRGTIDLDVFENTERHQLRAEVVGRQMRCYLDGSLIVETEFLDPVLTQGGVGFKTWRPNGNAHITIHSFSVDEVTSIARIEAE